MTTISEAVWEQNAQNTLAEPLGWNRCAAISDGSDGGTGTALRG